MKTRIIFLGSILLLAGCGGAAPDAPALSGQSALDANATLAVWTAQETAVAVETRRVEQATADAGRVTAEAETAARSTAEAHGTAVALDAEATAGALAVRATEAAASATATWDALMARQAQMAMEATATADAAALAFQEAQAAKTLAARQAEIDRERLWTRLIPWIVGLVAVTAAGVVLLVAGSWAVERWSRSRPQRAGDVWVLTHPDGPVLLNRPPAPVREAAPLLLPPPRPVETPEVLPELRRGHVLIAGPTDSGKSTAMRVVLRAREAVTVLDPHSAAGRDWGAARVVGAGRDFEAIREYMDEMARMLRERYAARAGGVTEFAALTVAVDEMPAIVGELGRGVEKTWREWLREGRKVGLFLVLSTQSTRVRTLGIEGEADLLENFTCALVLGDTALREYGAAAAGMERPAVLVTKGAARPVVIPSGNSSMPRQPETGHQPETAAPVLLPAPLFMAPVPAAEPDPDNMTDADRARVVAEFRRTRSLAAVQRAIFPSYRATGGRAFYAIKDALVEAGELPPYREDDGAGPNAPAPFAW